MMDFLEDAGKLKFKVIPKSCPVCESDSIKKDVFGYQCQDKENKCSMGKTWWMMETWKEKIKETGKGSFK